MQCVHSWNLRQASAADSRHSQLASIYIHCTEISVQRTVISVRQSCGVDILVRVRLEGHLR